MNSLRMTTSRSKRLLLIYAYDFMIFKIIIARLTSLAHQLSLFIYVILIYRTQNIYF